MFCGWQFSSTKKPAAFDFAGSMLLQYQQIRYMYEKGHFWETQLAAEPAPMLDRSPLPMIRHSNGGRSAANISPGKHTVRLEKQNYLPKEVEKEFAASATVAIRDRSVCRT